MGKYACPYQMRPNGIKFLICRKKITADTPEIRLTNPREAAKAYCFHQEYCSCSGQMENTQQAKKCYAEMRDK